MTPKPPLPTTPLPPKAASNIPVAARKRSGEKTQSDHQKSAAKAAEVISRQRLKQRTPEEGVTGEDLTFYYLCDDSDCMSAGIFLKGSNRNADGTPGGMLTEDMWWSSYHDLGDPYPANDIVCQSCYNRPGLDGKPSKRRVKLDMHHSNGRPIIKSDHLMPREDVIDPANENVVGTKPRGMTPGEFERLLEGKDPFGKDEGVDRG